MLDPIMPIVAAAGLGIALSIADGAKDSSRRVGIGDCAVVPSLASNGDTTIARAVASATLHPMIVG